MRRAPAQIILRPLLTEKSERLKQDGKYAFFVAPDANKIEIIEAIEEIYNRGKRKDLIRVLKVNVINAKGKAARAQFRTKGRRPNRKKAIVTLMPGQALEDIGA